MEVVNVFQRMSTRGVRAPLPVSARRVLWCLAVLDVMAVAWMLAAGDWFDDTSRLTSVVTLGGHSRLVFWLAVGGLLSLIVTAALTSGFAETDAIGRGLAALAGGLSVVATGGILSIVVLVVGVVALVAALGRAFLR